MLLQYRKMPHATMGIPPPVLMLGRQIRSRLDLMLPSRSKQINTNKQTGGLFLREGDRVSGRNYNSKEKWKFGKIIKRLGKLHYLIVLDDGRIWKRHQNQLRRIRENTPGQKCASENGIADTCSPADFDNMNEQREKEAMS